MCVNDLLTTAPFQESIPRLIQESQGYAFVLLCSDFQDLPEVLGEFLQSRLFGERKIKLIAICLDYWHEMDFVAPV